jgi:hypothetical protein
MATNYHQLGDDQLDISICQVYLGGLVRTNTPEYLQIELCLPLLMNLIPIYELLRLQQR